MLQEGRRLMRMICVFLYQVKLATESDPAQILVKAFEKFIIQVVHVHSLSGSNHKIDDDKRSDLGPEAQQLLIALKRFTTKLIRPDVATDAAASKNINHGAKPLPLGIYSVRLLISTKPTAVTFQKPRLLRLALDTMHHRVFNRMPIRLLTFKSDGSGIRLIERDEIWDLISAAIIKDFDEATIKSDIRRITEPASNQNISKDTESVETMVIRKFLQHRGRYAILSHTWLRNMYREVTYTNWINGDFDRNAPGYRKLADFCQAAARDHRVIFGWMDTICINKESSSELDESIRSMFVWYRNSHVCVTYLADTTNLQAMRRDTWFKRGWTLQELLAPGYLKFYRADWLTFTPGTGNDKTNDLILDEIQAATNITKKELQQDLWTIPISRRMYWAANREVTREEDIAYSLMGVFGTSISIAYGEGSERAFFRLAKEILNTNTLNLLDILNWGYGNEFPRPNTISHTSALIPQGPKQYCWRADKDIHWYTPTRPITLTHLGLHVQVLLMPAISVDPSSSHALAFGPVGNFYATAANVSLVYPNNKIRKRDFYLLEKSIFKSGSQNRTKDTPVFGILNFSETSTSIALPGPFHRHGACFAIPFTLTPPPIHGVIPEEITATHRIATKHAIVLDLKRFETDSFIIPKNELKRHGITMRTLYL